MAIEIVIFPRKNVIVHSYVNVYQGVGHILCSQAGPNFMGNPNGHVKPLQQKCFFNHLENHNFSELAKGYQFV